MHETESMKLHKLKTVLLYMTAAHTGYNAPQMLDNETTQPEMAGPSYRVDGKQPSKKTVDSNNCCCADVSAPYATL